MTMFTGHEGITMSVNVAEFKAKCLKLIDQVAVTHKPLVISKRGRPMAKLVPIDYEPPTSLFGYMKNTGQILGDIVDVPHEPFAAETGEEDDLYAGFKPKKKGSTTPP
ncbi:MAG: type II toxin-antitoxin system Phd/YefM family antitoxin [Acidiferrobacter sp.]